MSVRNLVAKSRRQLVDPSEVAMGATTAREHMADVLLNESQELSACACALIVGALEELDRVVIVS